mmetsp:Transcript_40098/g.119423  ORF Transcript_40098/g.119423 Transcript_40098/m.119423 type:complete len:289 (-) Transcript_40098:551-1417(-)
MGACRGRRSSGRRATTWGSASWAPRRRASGRTAPSGTRSGWRRCITTCTLERSVWSARHTSGHARQRRRAATSGRSRGARSTRSTGGQTSGPTSGRRRTTKCGTKSGGRTTTAAAAASSIQTSGRRSSTKAGAWQSSGETSGQRTSRMVKVQSTEKCGAPIRAVTVTIASGTRSTTAAAPFATTATAAAATTGTTQSTWTRTTTPSHTSGTILRCATRPTSSACRLRGRRTCAGAPRTHIHPPRRLHLPARGPRRLVAGPPLQAARRRLRRRRTNTMTTMTAWVQGFS